MSNLWSDDVYDDDCDRNERWIDGAGFWIALAVIWTLILLVGGVILFAVFQPSVYPGVPNALKD